MKSTGYETVPEANTAFDAMWALALALDKVQRAVCANDTLGCDAGPLTQLENYTYYNEQVECMLNKTLNLTGFQGVSVCLLIILALQLLVKYLSSNQVHVWCVCHA